MRNSVTLACAAVLAASPAHGQTSQDDDRDNGDVVVTGTRGTDPIAVSRSGSAITILDRDELEQRQVRAVSDVLRDVPGVAVGRIAGQTQIRLRGSEANHVLVLVDGIEVSDPNTGEFDFGTLAADEGARVEVLRGQQSSLYGSDAIGGVIQYITASGRDLPGYSARVEAGSFGTINAQTRAAGTAGDLDFALTGTLTSTNGQPNARGGTRDLADDTQTVALKSTWTPSANARLTGVVRYSHQFAEFNDSDADPTSPRFGYTVDTPGNHLTNDAVYALVRGEVDLLDGRWIHALSAQVADTTRNGYNARGRSYGDRGGRIKASYETTLKLTSGQLEHQLVFALDAERERYRNTDPSGFAFTGERTTDNIGLVGQYRLAIGQRADLAASVRKDLNNRFADATSYRVEATYRVAGGTRLRAASGSGVKNPGYYELYGYSDGRFIGNPGLRPEKSEGWEVGAEQRLVGDRIVLGGDFFHSALKDEIYTTYSAPTFVATPANRLSRSRQNGIETFLDARLGEHWRINAAHTYLHARESGEEEVRRPSHTASVAVAWRATHDRGGVTAVIRHTGEADDLAFTDPSYVPIRVRLGAYTLINLNADLTIGHRVSLFGRIENLSNQHYEDVFSFTNPGRAAIAGIRAHL